MPNTDFDPREVEEALGMPTPTKSTSFYNKFQVSKMFGDGYQLVIRADTYSELMKAMTEAKGLVDGIEKKVAPHKSVQAENTGLRSFCKEHGVEMVEGFSKKTNKPYWYHDGGEGRCFGKGYQPKNY